MFRGGSGNLILTGFMATGKTTVGQEIARRLDREFVDMDAEIEARSGKSVACLFAEEGEAHFRRQEARLCRELAARSGLVIATGGGTLIPDDNYEILSASGPVVCLTASVDEIVRRLGTLSDRPLIDPSGAHTLSAADRLGRVVTLLGARSEGYKRIPLQVETTGLTVGEVADRVLAVADQSVEETLVVHHPGGEYPIRIGRGLLARLGPLLDAQGINGHVAVVTNLTVGGLYGACVVDSLKASGFGVTCCVVPEGEEHKTLDTVRTLYDQFVEARMDRRSVVLALGGGVIGDLAGFAAATFLRGVTLVHSPTTLLAIVDSSVGGKVAVDHPQGKNLIGAFKQPALVIADLDTLSSLSEAEFANGLAEVIKAGLIGDPLLFEQIEEFGPAPLPWIIERAIRVKLAVVEGDPYELGGRAVLNLGHTFGHALELLSGYRLPHGHAVSIGLVAAARLSARLANLPAAGVEALFEEGLAERIERVLARYGLPSRYQGHEPDEVWLAMSTDKKRLGKTLRFILPRAVGNVFVCDWAAPADVVAVLESLQAVGGSRVAR